MRILVLILTVLLSVQIAFPYQVCGAEEVCPEQQLETPAKQATHACCAQDTDPGTTDRDCQDDCSCSCCRVLIKVPSIVVDLPDALSSRPQSPVHRHSLRLLELGDTIGQPPQLAWSFASSIIDALLPHIYLKDELVTHPAGNRFV